MLTFTFKRFAKGRRPGSKKSNQPTSTIVLTGYSMQTRTVGESPEERTAGDQLMIIVPRGTESPSINDEVNFNSKKYRVEKIEDYLVSANNQMLSISCKIH